MEEKSKNQTGQGPQGTATHSGWNHFYVLFSKYRDECIKVGQIVFGTNSETALRYIVNYHSALYSMAQQIFSFYSSDVEKDLTETWFELQDQINEMSFYANDKDFRSQMLAEGKELIPRKLKTDLLMFFNKVDRFAAEAGLLVGKENKGLNEPKKGLMGFRK